MNNSVQILENLKARTKISDNTAILYHLIENDDLENIKLLVNSGANAEACELLRLTVCQSNNLEIIKCIVDHIDMEYINEALELAALFNKSEMVKYLVDFGADVSFRGYAAMHYAAEKGNWDLVKYLIEHGSDLHSSDEHVLWEAAFSGSLDMVQYLVERNANMNVGDDGDDNALVIASAEGHMDIVQYLVEQGIANNFKKEALRYATMHGREKIITYLQENIN